MFTIEGIYSYLTWGEFAMLSSQNPMQKLELGSFALAIDGSINGHHWRNCH